jgi:phosphotriesterase-related protein
MFISRRDFLISCIGSIFLGAKSASRHVMTVNGMIPVSQLGKSLVHEHFLVDFIGADKINFDRWNRKEVVEKVLPFIKEAKKQGVKTMFDCTPAYLGRDPSLLKLLHAESGMQIVTNTGYYGAVQNKYLPAHALTETAEQLSNRWIKEFTAGIDGTPIRPGFIKISVDAGGRLSDIHQKLVRAAALTHLQTGLTIFSHTGIADAAFQQLELLEQEGVSPAAFVWVHAQAEKDKSLHSIAARKGAWVSLDGIAWGNLQDYADSIGKLKSEGLLNKVLISHDAGWFRPEEPHADFKGFTNIFHSLFPILKSKGFSDLDFHQLLVKNPAAAMYIHIRRLK